MPWNDQKGGWQQGGGGGRGPWGQGPQRGNGGGGGGGGGIQPPDLEELMRKGRERLKTLFPNQSPVAVIAGLLGGVLLLLWLSTGVYQIAAAEQGVVLRFGQVVDTLGPGLHFRFPQPIETVQRVNIGDTQQIDIGYTGGEDPAADSMMLTGDQNMMHVGFTVMWRVKNPQDYLFRVEDVPGTIRAVGESAMREAVGQTGVDIIMTTSRAQIEKQVHETSQQLLDFYAAGVQVVSVTLQETKPPKDVNEAFIDVQAATADQQSKINQAERYANTVVPRANGEAAKIVQDAEAAKNQAVTLAKGEAQRFLSIYEQYRLAPLVTRERMYVETMQRVLGGANKVIVEGGSSNVLPYLPLNQLRPPTQQPSGTPAPAGGNP